MNDQELMQQGVEDLKRILFERNQSIAQRDARIAELESDLEDWRFTNKIDEQERELARRGARIAELEAAIDRMNESQGRFAFGEKRAALMAVRNKSLHK